MPKHPSPEFSAAVLAGGRSRRFGEEKAMADLHGRPLIAWVLDALSAVAAPIAISAPTASGAAQFGARAGFDIVPDGDGQQEGTIFGISACLAWASQRGKTWLVTQPCDVPVLPVGALPRLVAACRDNLGAFAHGQRGAEPLIAVWPVACAGRLAEMKQANLPIKDILTAFNATPVHFDEEFSNINSRSDLDALARRLSTQHR